MKDTFYFSHDQNARGDAKCVRLIREMKWEGYGLYWALVEMLYESKGRIDLDYELLAYDLRSNSDTLKRIVTGFDLFYRDGKKIGSHSVDKRLSERQARIDGARASANARWSNADAMRTHCDGNARNKQTKKERNTTAPSAVDLSKLADSKNVKNALSKDASQLLEIQMPYGNHKGRRVGDMPADDCQWQLDNTPRLGLDLRRALQARIDQKKSESIS